MACVPSEQKSEMRSFKSFENIHKKEDGSYYIVLANKASSVTLSDQSLGCPHEESLGP